MDNQVAEAPAVEEKKEIDYRGVVKKLDELKDGAVVQRIANPPNVKIPKFFILDKLKNSYQKGVKEVALFDTKSFNRRSLYIPEGTEVKELTGRQGKEFLARFLNHQRSQIFTNLQSVFMTIGSDPEIFIEDAGGNIIPAFTFLKSKADADKSPKNELGGDMKVYWDGFQAEFETTAPLCHAHLADSIRTSLKNLLSLAKKANPTARLSSRTVVQIPDAELDRASEEHVTFGCAPSMNVYEIEGKREDGRVVPYRFAGGHIHLGIGKRSQKEVDEIVKTLDAIVGLASVSLFANQDDPIRREYYGLPGEYRLPPHGIEYRTLSNAWMFHPVMMNLIFALTRRTVAFAVAGHRRHILATEQEIVETIRSSNVEQARKIIERNKDIFLGLLKTAFKVDKAAEVAYNVIMKGMEEAVENPNDIAKNWKLDSDWLQHSSSEGCNWKSVYEKVAKGEKV